MFYIYSDFGIETSLRAGEASFGLGAHLGDWLGGEFGLSVSLDGFTISETLQISPIFHCGVSIGTAGIGINLEVDIKNATQDLDITIGWPIVGAALFCMGISNPLNMLPIFGG